MTLLVKKQPANAGDVRDPSSIPGGWEDSLEEGMATHSSTLARRTLWTEGPSRWQRVLRVAELGTSEVT